jgi:serine/threonine-protein kinase
VEDQTSFIPADNPQDSTSIFSGGVPAADERKKRWPLVLLAVAILVLLVAAAVFGQKLFQSAPEQKSVPSVLMMTKSEATQALKDAGLTVGKVSRQASADVAKNHVISSDPNQGAMLDPGTPVDLTVSTGKPDVVVPYVIGKNRDEAQQLIEAKGLRVKFVKRQSDEDPDTVIDTNPQAAESVSTGSLVTVYYSAGPKQVPNVVGMRQGPATAALKKAGFDVSVTYDSQTREVKGKVLQQAPDALTTQPQGTTVVITVSSYVEPTSPSETPSPTTPTQSAPTSPSLSPPTGSPLP